MFVSQFSAGRQFTPVPGVLKVSNVSECVKLRFLLKHTQEYVLRHNPVKVHHSKHLAQFYVIQIQVDQVSQCISLRKNNLLLDTDWGLYTPIHIQSFLFLAKR